MHKAIEYNSQPLHINVEKVGWGVIAIKNHIDERAVELANYILETGATVRSCAAKFGISKSTVHKDVTERLQKLHPSLYKEVAEVLLKNKGERHIRGGLATREKYRKNSLKNG